jgi:hypothetical protein
MQRSKTSTPISTLAKNIQTTTPNMMWCADGQCLSMEEIVRKVNNQNSPVNFNTKDENALRFTGQDFALGSGNKKRGNSGFSRAMVKDNKNVLKINYNNDFTGGTEIDSNLKINGVLDGNTRINVKDNSGKEVIVSLNDMFKSLNVIGEKAEKAFNNVSQTLAPITTTFAPITTTLAPITTTLAPITTTFAPITTTLAPITTTLAPITTTLAPRLPYKCNQTSPDDKVGCGTGMILRNDEGYFVFFNEREGIIDLVKRKEVQQLLWRSNYPKPERGPYRLVMQDDGNLVMYDRENRPRWASGTYGRGQGPYSFELSPGGKLVIIGRNGPIWYALERQVCPQKPYNSDGCGNGVILETSEHLVFFHKEDGFLDLVKKSEGVKWRSNDPKPERGPYRLVMQEDGNLVIYDRENRPTWASGTGNRGQGPYALQLMGDGKLRIIANNGPIWEKM